MTESILSRMRESVRNAALHALEQQKNDSSAKIWMERRIFRPAQQIFERATQVKKSSLPPPSARASQATADRTGTWKKLPATAKNALTSLPAPPSLRRDEQEGARSALERALARPDRASIPPVKRPTPPPPGVQVLAPPLPLEPAQAGSSGPSTSSLSKPLSASIPPVSQTSEKLETRPDERLSALGQLGTQREQAALILKLILEVAPAQSVLIHTVDPRTQEATTVGAHGAHAAALSDFTTEAQDPLLTQIRRLRRPVKILSPTTDERSGKGRWALSPPEKYLAALPVLHGHKLLGFIELADPLTGNRLTQDQLDAVLDLARVWGERLAKG